jgi:hypothetical protein
MLKPSKIIEVGENDDVTLRGIASMSLSGDSKKVAIVDRSGYFVSKFNAETGRIISYFQSSDSLTRYFTLNKRNYWKDLTAHMNFLGTKQTI